MTMKIKIAFKAFAFLFILQHWALPTIAQEKKVAPTSTALFTTIQQMDSALFTAYNTKNLTQLKLFFTKEVEWFQDNDGLLSYTTLFNNFETIFKKPYTLTRTLVANTLEVHPIKNYGAIEIGTHQFTHIENGKEEIGTFKFLMIWQQKEGQWKISKVVSYDH
jgi:hypothetical protein